MNARKIEHLQGTQQAKVGTDIFITDKPGVTTLPDEKNRGPPGLKKPKKGLKQTQF